MSSMKRRFSERMIKKYFLNNKYMAIKFSLFYLVIALVATIFINRLFFDPESSVNDGNVVSFNFIFLFLFFTVIILFLILNYLQNVISKIDKSYKDLKNKEEERLIPYEFALNNSFDEIFWFTIDAKIVYINDAACKSLGYQKEELLGKYLEVIDPNFTRESAIQVMFKIKNTPNFILETIQRKKMEMFFLLKFLDTVLIIKDKFIYVLLVETLRNEEK